MKYLVVALVVLVALYIWKSARAGREDERGTAAPKAPAAVPPSRQIEMVRCESCGLHLPREDAHAVPAASGPRYFCSVEHRDARAS